MFRFDFRYKVERQTYTKDGVLRKRPNPKPSRSLVICYLRTCTNKRGFGIVSIRAGERIVTSAVSF